MPDTEPIRVGHHQRARPLWAAEPLLAGHRVVVEPGCVDGQHADGLSAINKDGDSRLRTELVDREDGAGRPEDM